MSQQPPAWESGTASLGGAGAPPEVAAEVATARPPLSRVPGWVLRWGTTAWMLIGILIIAAAIYLGLAQVSTLVGPLVVAAVMGMLFHPLVDRLAALGIRRGMGATIILVGLVVIVAASLYLAVRGVFDQGAEIGRQIEQGWALLQDRLAGLGLDLSAIEQAVSNLGSNAGSGITGVVTATVSGVGLFVVGVFIGAFLLYYLLKDWYSITGWLAGHTGVPSDLGQGLIEDTTRSIRQYFYALTLTSIPIAIVIGLVMWILGLPLAFTVVLVTFVTAYIPYIGAIVSGALATLIALGSGGLFEAAIVLAAVLLTQNVLQALLLTRLSSTTLRIHPIVNFGSTIVGATLAGIIGATLSAPVVASLLAAQRRISTYRWVEDAVTPPPGPDDGAPS